jgi:transcriptional regulator with XRE-family HTH domain
MNDVDAQTGVTTEIETDDLGKEEQKSRFILLRAKGLSYAKIAKELKVSTSTLTNWNQELLEEIAQAKSMELEALQEEYFMLKEGRIKLLGGQLKTIQEEISGRDLSKVSTERLMAR